MWSLFTSASTCTTSYSCFTHSTQSQRYTKKSVCRVTWRAYKRKQQQALACILARFFAASTLAPSNKIFTFVQNLKKLQLVNFCFCSTFFLCSTLKSRIFNAKLFSSFLWIFANHLALALSLFLFGTFTRTVHMLTTSLVWSCPLLLRPMLNCHSGNWEEEPVPTTYTVRLLEYLSPLCSLLLFLLPGFYSAQFLWGYLSMLISRRPPQTTQQLLLLLLLSGINAKASIPTSLLKNICFHLTLLFWHLFCQVILYLSPKLTCYY